MIDSHCHLGIDDYKEDIEGALDRSRQANVSHILTVACSYDQISDLKKMLEYPSVYGAFGIHPEYAEIYQPQQDLQSFFQNPKIVALGEIGLDFHYRPETKELQKKVFIQQLEQAIDFKKPVIIHTREAEEETIQILKEHSFQGKLKGVMHCFTGSQKLAEAALNLGFYISASGVITFKNASNLRAVFKHIPLDRLLIETDSPYLAPVPLRGKRNEPSFLPKILEILAQIKGVSAFDLSKITTDNFNTLFLKRNNNEN